MKSIKFLTAFILVLLFAIPTAAPQEQHPIVIAISPWVGYGSLYVAKDMGFFDDVDVKIKIVKEQDERIAQLMGRYAQIVACPAGAMLRNSRKEVEFKAFLVIDESRGGDGLVTMREISDIRDLSGRKVSMALYSPSEFWFDMLLERRDLEDLKEEIKFVNVEGLKALSAFRRGDIDAIVGREPFLSSVVREFGGSIIATSNETPGLVVDVLFSQRDTIERRHDDFEKVVRGVYRAVDWMERNPYAAKRIIKKYFGENYRVASDFDNTFSAVAFYDRNMNMAYFGTEDDPGNFEETLDDIIDYWKERGELSWKPDPEDFIDYSLVPTYE
jgi:NitT/TauT family transport system substrate-binding protein